MSKSGTRLLSITTAKAFWHCHYVTPCSIAQLARAHTPAARVHSMCAEHCALWSFTVSLLFCSDDILKRCMLFLALQIQAVQHKRYEVFVLHRDLRRLLLVAIATDEQLLAEQSKHIAADDVEGRLRYPSCIFAIGKVLDRITAAARCALDAGKPSMLYGAAADGSSTSSQAQGKQQT